MLQFLIIAGLFQSSYSCTKIDNCSCKKSNGHIMNLRPIDGGKSGPKFTGEEPSKPENYKFLWNPCTPFSLPFPDGCKGVLLCQSNSKLRYPVGANVESFAEAKGTDTITITYSPMTKDGVSRQGVITLECDRSKYPGEFITPFSQSSKGGVIQYRATFASKCVCDDGCSSTPAGNHGWKLKGPSTVSILLIVVIQLAFIYCINGTLYNEYKGGYGSFPDLIPNHSFWIELPSFIKVSLSNHIIFL
ncbi:PREDICTED: uncharacterized protein LOC107351081 isoform X2 [Acropora digitifera]|uniref:uncharacterized protein LOC107351081 isoform X2 n=1 Tax=Acropora digitifera TaxID=70779 RepID=UPI00077A2A56|nr:PREDICTED: uncharacterized protein LOC107351081 isoform X2 [Acropora digitifera]